MIFTKPWDSVRFPTVNQKCNHPPTMLERESDEFWHRKWNIENPLHSQSNISIQMLLFFLFHSYTMHFIPYRKLRRYRAWNAISVLLMITLFDTNARDSKQLRFVIMISLPWIRNEWFRLRSEQATDCSVQSNRPGKTVLHRRLTTLYSFWFIQLVFNTLSVWVFFCASTLTAIYKQNHNNVTCTQVTHQRLGLQFIGFQFQTFLFFFYHKTIRWRIVFSYCFYISFLGEGQPTVCCDLFAYQENHPEVIDFVSMFSTKALVVFFFEWRMDLLNPSEKKFLNLNYQMMLDRFNVFKIAMIYWNINFILFKKIKFSFSYIILRCLLQCLFHFGMLVDGMIETQQMKGF